MLESTDKDFGGDFVDRGTKANRAEVIDLKGLFNFGNQTNERLIPVERKGFVPKGILDVPARP